MKKRTVGVKKSIGRKPDITGKARKKKGKVAKKKSGVSSKKSSANDLSVDVLLQIEEALEARSEATAKAREATKQSKLAVETATEVNTRTLQSESTDNFNALDILEETVFPLTSELGSPIGARHSPVSRSSTTVEKSVMRAIREAMEHKRTLYGHTIETTQKLFKRMDVDKSGFLSIGEVSQALRRLDIGLSPDQISVACERLTKLNNGKITYEVLANTIHGKKLASGTAASLKEPIRSFGLTGSSRQMNSKPLNSSASLSKKHKQFHYLGGSVSLQAERKRRVELEERLLEVHAAVRRQAQHIQPTVEALVTAVKSLEAGAEEQLRLEDETQNTLEYFRTEMSSLKAEMKKEIRKARESGVKELSRFKEEAAEQVRQEREEFGKVINGLRSELALLRSEFTAHRDTVHARLDVIPESMEEMKNLYSGGIAPLESSLQVLQQKVNGLDSYVFKMDKEHLKMRLTMRSHVGPAATDENGKMILDGDPAASMGAMSNVQPWELSRDVKALRKEISILKVTMSESNSNLRTRLEDGAGRIRSAVERVDAHHAEYTEAMGELQQLMNRSASIVRNEARDNLNNLRSELCHMIEKAARRYQLGTSTIASMRMSSPLSSEDVKFAVDVNDVASA